MAETKVKAEVKRPRKLSDEDKAKIVEEYLGVHPKYFVYEGQKIKVDIWNMERDGKLWRDWTPHLKELGEL